MLLKTGNLCCRSCDSVNRNSVVAVRNASGRYTSFSFVVMQEESRTKGSDEEKRRETRSKTEIKVSVRMVACNDMKERSGSCTRNSMSFSHSHILFAASCFTHSHKKVANEFLLSLLLLPTARQRRDCSSSNIHSTYRMEYLTLLSPPRFLYLSES